MELPAIPVNKVVDPPPEKSKLQSTPIPAARTSGSIWTKRAERIFPIVGMLTFGYKAADLLSDALAGD
jgi:hypothetical protein